MSSTSANAASAGGAAATSSSSSTSLPRLGPAWYRGAGNQGGRGFQPPPAVPSERESRGGTFARDRSGSAGSGGGDNKRDNSSNSFSVLDDDDGGATHGANGGSKHEDAGGTRRGGERFSTRSEGLRSSSFNRSSSSGSMTGSGGVKPGRSLADLAARVPGSSGRSSGYRGSTTGPEDGGALGGRASGVRGEFTSGDASGYGKDGSTSLGSASPGGGKVVRYTREKLLSIRPQPKPGAENPPSMLKHLEGTVILAKEAQDPVCWDTFDADEIWAQAARERPRGSIGSVLTKGPPGGGTTGSRVRSGSEGIDDNGRGSTSTGGGRWQRGVALPPADEPLSRTNSRSLSRGASAVEAENPDDLWDDPVGGATSAAADFSQFGALPEDGRSDGGRRSRGGSMGSGGGFDLSEMSAAARRFEEELHGPKSRTLSSGDLEKDVPKSEHSSGSESLPSPVDPLRPLASAGTTIRSGSGDDVNVFEDFGAPTAPSETASSESVESSGVIKAGGEEISASSRIMQMIGVTPGGSSAAAAAPSASKLVSSWGVNNDESIENAEKTDAVAKQPEITIAAPASSIPSNPWGDTIIPGGASQNQQQDGMDLAARLEAAVAEQKARDAQAAAEVEQQRQKEEAEIMRRRQQQEEEEAKRQQAQKEAQAAAQAQQHAEAQARQQQAAALQHQQQQPATGHSQVEMVLMERISTILENSWGRSDLMSILTTLHTEDSRVIPLLGSVDALRALIARHPRRVALAKDPAFGAEMAVLVVTNAQWNQQHAQAQAKAQQEELQRQRQQQQQQQQQQQIQAAQQAAAARAQAEAEERERVNAAVQLALENQTVTITDAPWFYADPQGNIQGPFGGEEMRQWLEAGYFKGDLPISQNPSGHFRALSTLFPDPSIAFKPTAPDSSTEEEEAKAAAKAAAELKRAQEEAAALAAEEKAQAEAEAKAQAEKKKREKEAAEAAAAAEAEARAKAEEEARAKAHAEAKARAEEEARALAEAEAKAQAQKHVQANLSAAPSDQNSSSAQLKMLLGLGGPIASQAESTLDSHDGVVVAGPPQKKEQSSSPPSQRASGSQQQPPPQQQNRAKQQNAKAKSQQRASASVPVQAPGPAKAPPPTAWGGAAKTTGRKKSMSEIQQEEARVAARLAKERHTVSRSSSGGWANIASAGGGSTAWASGMVKQTPARVVSTAPSASASSQNIVPSNANMPVRTKQQAQAAAAQKQMLAQQRGNAQKSVDDFGANGRLSPALESWCKDQMRKLNGSDDLTLVAFCMTLSDPVEIRQYLTAYLGSTPQVNNFATEFINRKGGNQGKQEEWESAGNVKKGKKKKGGASAR